MRYFKVVYLDCGIMGSIEIVSAAQLALDIEHTDDYRQPVPIGEATKEEYDTFMEEQAGCLDCYIPLTKEEDEIYTRIIDFLNEMQEEAEGALE